MNEHAKEVLAGVGTAGSWAIWGYSLNQLNELLTTVSLIAATVASIAAAVYYISNRKRRG
jgi:hypothetical protein